MNQGTDDLVLPRWMRPWEEFWFRPADPTLLALMRITCGIIVIYTMVVYSVKLQDFFGESAWLGLPLRMEIVRDAPVHTGPLLSLDTPQLPTSRPTSEEEARAIEEYIKREGVDPRALYTRGMTIFSLWFHVTDPTAMAVLHGLVIASAFCFTVGLCTRLTTALTWFGCLWYIHRTPTVTFGADQIMLLIILYLMISPCGAVLSVDRRIRRRWTGASEPVQPSVATNLAIRLLQVHLCVIYLAAGLAKLLGPTWWNGTAVWGTIACYEFAPMQNAQYMAFLRFLSRNQLVYGVVVSGGGLFTVAFEIAYAFLIWRPSLRWVFLFCAILLHGFIGLFMGLQTFSLLMLVMNMAFLRKTEVDWILAKAGITKTSL